MGHFVVIIFFQYDTKRDGEKQKEESVVNQLHIQYSIHVVTK